MKAKTERFLGGFFGTLILLALGAAVFALMAWVIFIIGPLVGGVVAVVLIALFAGIMNANTPDKEQQ
jgi:hypothetical protein